VQSEGSEPAEMDPRAARGKIITPRV